MICLYLKRVFRCFYRRSKKKPIISGPFPADPDQLEGEKWRYVILTRLDTEPPPERPPRTKRHRPQRTEIATVGRGWGSVRRRSRGVRDIFPRRSGRRAAGADVRDRQRLSAAELAELVLRVYRRGPVGRPQALPEPPRAEAGHRCDAECACRPPVRRAAVERYTAARVSRPGDGRRQFGFFQSVGRARAMADNLLL